MFISYQDTVHFSKELLNKLEIRGADEPDFWYFHGESPETHDFFIAAIKRAAEMQKDGSYKTFVPFQKSNSELDTAAYNMFFCSGGEIILDWNERKEKFEIVNGRHRLRMMQLHDIEMDLKVSYGFEFKLMKDEEEIKENVPEKVVVDKKSFWDLFKKIKYIFYKNEMDKIKNDPNFSKENSIQVRQAIAINIDDLSDEILEKIGIKREEILESKSCIDQNAKNFFTDDKFGIIENKNHDLDEVINKLKDEKN